MGPRPRRRVASAIAGFERRGVLRKDGGDGGLRGGGEGVLEWVEKRERGCGARIRAAVGGGTPAMERAGEH